MSGEVWIALFGSVAVVSTAVIAGSAALLGQLLAGRGARAIVQDQVAAASAAARIDELRGERRRRVASFERDLAAIQAEMAGHVSLSAGEPAGESDEFGAARADHLEQLFTLSGNALAKVPSSLLDVLEALNNAFGQLENAAPGDEISKAESAVWICFERVQERLSDFIVDGSPDGVDAPP